LTRGRAVSAKGGPASGGGSLPNNDMLYTVYVLKSLKNNKRYVGFTSKSAEERLKDHHGNTNKWTKQNKPFKLVYSENFETKTDAIKREKILKSGQGRKYLDSMLKDKK
jgi:putative endonuclease